MAKDLRATRDYMRDARAGTLGGRRWVDYKNQYAENNKGFDNGSGKSAYSAIHNAKSYDDVVSVAAKHDISIGENVQKRVKDAEVVRGLVQELGWMRDEFPIMNGNQTSIGINARYKAYAVNNSADWSISLARSIMSDPTVDAMQKLYARDVAKGYHPANSDWTHIGTHEGTHSLIDHIIDKAARGSRFRAWYKEQWTDLPYSTDVRVRDAVVDTILDKALGIKPWHDYKSTARTVSGYAADSREEFIAEAVVDYRANGSKAQPCSKAIYKTLKSMSNDNGYFDLIKIVSDNKTR